jgi:hypothetical protein
MSLESEKFKTFLMMVYNIWEMFQKHQSDKNVREDCAKSNSDDTISILKDNPEKAQDIGVSGIARTEMLRLALRAKGPCGQPTIFDYLERENYMTILREKYGENARSQVQVTLTQMVNRGEIIKTGKGKKAIYSLNKDYSKLAKVKIN